MLKRREFQFLFIVVCVMFVISFYCLIFARTSGEAKKASSTPVSSAVVATAAKSSGTVSQNSDLNSNNNSSQGETAPSIDISKLKITFPSKNWKSDMANAYEMHFYENGTDKGELYLAPLYSGQTAEALMPNHSSIVSKEDINIPLGSGTLLILERQNPAADPVQKTWYEMHAVIPASDGQHAYHIWLTTEDTGSSSKAMFMSFIKQIHF